MIQIDFKFRDLEILDLLLNCFSADENLVNLKDKVVTMNDGIQIPDEYKLKNLATGGSIYSDKFASTKCSGIFDFFE